MSEKDDKYNRSPAGRERNTRYQQSEKGQARSREYAKRKYERKKAAGICAKTGCEDPADHGVYCFGHHRQTSDYHADQALFGPKNREVEGGKR